MKYAQTLAAYACLLLSTAGGAEFHVAPDGDDVNPGTLEKPFRTIQQAADTYRPGDTCFVQGG
ncbi:MAG: sugar isomerase, partial [Planctomycetes bacterium]|nr:sugar isomerase [Planctomycetota bacterium]